MRYFLVCNPGASSGKSRRKVQEYKALLGSQRADFECGYTRDLDDAAGMARRAVEDGCDAVVAVGGDGTINRVLNGLLAAEGAPGRCALGVLYSGTSPDFCRFHGLPTAPADAVAALLDGSPHPIDVCRMTHPGPDARDVRAYFASSANLGLGAGVARRANRCRAYLGDFLGTLLAATVTIIAARPSAFDVFLDGRRLRLESVLNVTVGKNPHIASGLRLAIDIAPDDRRMFVFAIAGVGKLPFLLSLPKVYSGSIADSRRAGTGAPGFPVRWARSVRVEPVRARVPAEYDGDPAGLCPVQIDLLPGAVRLLGTRR